MPTRRAAGTGFGVDIVRRRLAAAFGDRAALTAEAADGAVSRVGDNAGRGAEITMTRRRHAAACRDRGRRRAGAAGAAKRAVGDRDVTWWGSARTDSTRSRPSPTSQPDVVLLDVQMPKLDGFEVLELIGPDVPVVFVTAYDEFALEGVRGARGGLSAEARGRRAAGARRSRRVRERARPPRRAVGGPARKRAASPASISSAW